MAPPGLQRILGIGGHEHNPRLRRGFFDAGGELQAVDVRHPDVGKDKIRNTALIPDGIQRRLTP